ncbi:MULTISPECIES: hypothetical protein [unclassified Yoonia]|uniref:hypothetical protein n=1 Tax=unclassified Yoonia TaxID=2629118 RepID=UPI002AFDCF97|nr:MULTISPECIES: hypothetical protein [unclassified Yoonia]
MNKIFATTALALSVFAGATAATAQTLESQTGADEVTCAEFQAMELIDQETMLGEIVALSEGRSIDNTDPATVDVLCTGNDEMTLVEVLED